MSEHKLVNVYFFSRFERLAHWLQMLLIVTLTLTGFEVHGTYTLFGYKNAVKIHNTAAITWIVMFWLFVFWALTTGEWKQYIPTTKKVFEVIMFYSYGIFIGQPHPVKKCKDAKHNPLQRIVYLVVATIILPIQISTGLLYLLYNSWDKLGLGFLSLRVVAFLHLAGAVVIISFVIVHVYMTTTGHTPLAHIMAMITGWEEVEECAEIEEWETVK